MLYNMLKFFLFCMIPSFVNSVSLDIYIPEEIKNLTLPQYFSTLAPIKQNFVKLIFLKIKNYLPVQLVNLIFNKFDFKIFWESFLFQEIGILVKYNEKISKIQYKKIRYDIK